MPGTDFYEMREYFYDKDYNFYHYLGKKDEGQYNIERITRAEYKRQTGESDYIIEKLRNSVWPHQANDYYFLKINTMKGGTRYAPIDWKISNLVKYFNKNGIPTGNSTDQGVSIASIGIKTRNDFITIMENLFGPENLVTVEGSHDYRKGNFRTRIKEVENLTNKYKIVLIIFTTINHKGIQNKEKINILLYNHKHSDWIHNKLGIEVPKHENSHKGSRIISGRAEEYINNLDQK